MSDPRFTDQRFDDPRQTQPVLRRGDSVGGVWGWIAGLAVVALLAFIVIAGWNNGTTNSANNGVNNNPPITTGAATRADPPSTTGSGATSPSPMSPLPSKNGTQ